MNPLSSFSFDKIIKTFIPGLIATGVPLLLIELLYRLSQVRGCEAGAGLWQCFLVGSFFNVVVLRDTARATAFGAALLPLALMLGFFINTALWLWVNSHFRRWADHNMDGRLLAARKVLETRAVEGLGTVLGSRDSGIPRTHLQDFYSPLLDLDKLTLLRESYFSWFEFQVNSAAALLLTGITCVVTIVRLGYKWSVTIDWAGHVVVPLALVAAVVTFLVFAAERNLRRYQEGFLWFLAGTLHFPPKEGTRPDRAVASG
jgi:hypothetical protein